MNILKSIHRSPFHPLTLVVILGLMGATQALASDPPSVKVGFRDLDLSTQAGAHTLYRRIAAAASQVCGYEGRGLTEIAVWNTCYKSAIDDAVVKVNSPLLTAEHTGHMVPPTVAMLSK
jgi:UrcA family protein